MSFPLTNNLLDTVVDLFDTEADISNYADSDRPIVINAEIPVIDQFCWLAL